VLNPTRADFRALLELAVPLAAVQVGLMLMGLVDAAMVGRLSADALGAVAVANVWFFAITTIAIGCSLALDPIISQAKGAGDETGIALGLQRGLLVAAGLCLPTVLGLAAGEPVLKAAGQTPTLVPLAGEYLLWILPGVLPHLAFLSTRQALQALGIVRPVLLVILTTNLLNAGLNWILIFGHLGAPALGIRGAALATTASRWAMCLGLVMATWPRLRRYLLPVRAEIWEAGPLRRLLGIGIPVGFQLLAEYGVFGLVGLLLGRVGSVAVAGHQIALNFAALTFMVPLGIGAAAAVIVGRAVGARDPEGARRVATAAVVTGAGFMIVTALLLVSFPRGLAAWYSPDEPVIAMAASLLPLAGLFQVFDGTQAVAMGVLRGLGDAKAPVVINVLGYYVIGLPIGLVLGFREGLGGQGLWWGLVVGLAVVAALLIGRVLVRMRRPLERIEPRGAAVAG